MKRRKKELWENLMVVWQDAMSGGRDWYITRVVNHHATENAVAPKSVADNELMASIIRGYMVKASSKEEALLRYRVFGHAAAVWSIAGGEGELSLPGSYFKRYVRYRLVKEDF